MLTLTTPAELRLAAIFLADLARLRDEPDAPDLTDLPRIEPEPEMPAPAAVPPAIPAASVPTTAPDLDSSGLPWDARIHSASKAMNADGTWRQRRGLNDAALRSAVEAELRAGLAGITPVAVAAPPVPMPPAVPVPPAPPTPPAPVATPTTLAEFMAALTPRMVQGHVAMAQIIAACSAHGLATLRDLGERPECIPAVWSALNV